MNITVVSLSQDVSFEDGSITNFVHLRLPTGQVIRAVVGDESAKLLVENFAMAKTGAPMPRPQTPAPEPEEERESFQETVPARREVNEEGAAVFGGNYGGDQLEETEQQPLDWNPPPATPQAPQQAMPQPPPAYQSAEQQAREYSDRKRGRARQNPMGTQNGRHVPKDEHGYPILGNNGGVEVGDVLGGGDRDEDGIGQV